MLCILKSIVAWVIMLLVGTNLIGLVVRGLCWSSPSIDAPTDRVQKVLKRESSRMSTTNAAMTIGSAIVTLVYFFALFHFWNSGLALAGAIIMASRLPDLIWEIRAGRKPAHKDRPKGPVYFLASTFLWAALILIWYSLCKWKF
jgi:hypothetical protein